MNNLRITLFIFFAFAQFLTSRFHEVSGLGRSVGAMANDAPTPATPAGFAFLIWILIFALWAACAGYQARSSQRSNLLWQRISWPMILAMAAGNLWMLTAILYGNGLTLLALIIIMAAGAFTALGRAVATIGREVPATSFNTRVLLPALGLMAGWLTLATFLNLSGTIQLTFGIPTGSRLGAITTITVATIVGGYVLAALRRKPSAAISYASALLWGLLGIVLANANAMLSPIGYTSPLVAVVALLCAAGVWIILACQLRKPRRES